MKTAAADLRSTLTALLDAAPTHASASTVVRLGPVPVHVHASRSSYLDDLTAHCCGDPSTAPWRPITVFLLDGDAMPEAAVPEVLRPRCGPGPTPVARDRELIAAVHGDLLWVADVDRGIAMRWSRRADDVPIWETAKPVRFPLRAASVAHGGAMLHAAAVAGRDGAVLLAGRGGAGKSTTAFACLGRGLRVLADDYCLAAPPTGAEPPVVHPTYLIGNLDENSLRLLPHLRARVVGRGPHDKLLVPLDALPASALTAPLRAVCAVAQRPGAATCLQPLSRGEALRVLAPSTMLQLPGLDRETWAATSAIVRHLDAYRLVVGDVAAAPDALAEFLGEAA